MAASDDIPTFPFSTVTHRENHQVAHPSDSNVLWQRQVDTQQAFAEEKIEGGGINQHTLRRGPGGRHGKRDGCLGVVPAFHSPHRRQDTA